MVTFRAGQTIPMVQKPTFIAGPDTEAMMNGLKLSDTVGKGEGISFDEMTAQTGEPMSRRSTVQTEAVSRATDSPGERRRREHDDYKKSVMQIQHSYLTVVVSSCTIIDPMCLDKMASGL